MALFLFVAGFVGEFENNLFLTPALSQDFCPDFCAVNQWHTDLGVSGRAVANHQHLVKIKLTPLFFGKFFYQNFIARGDFVLLASGFNYRELHC